MKKDRSTVVSNRKYKVTGQKTNPTTYAAELKISCLFLFVLLPLSSSFSFVSFFVIGGQRFLMTILVWILFF